MLNAFEYFIQIANPHALSLHIYILVAALAVDAILGEPDWLWRRLPHPVVIFGRAISFASKLGNRNIYSGRRRRINGMIAIIILAVVAGIFASILMAASTFMAQALGSWVLIAVEGIIVAILLASRSLHDHVQRVSAPLKAGNIADARHAISMIVGRNPDELDAPAIARASIETTAENLSDGVIAPAFFYLVFGIPGIIIYKMINTADSMIGYKSARYFAFGTGAARLDDLVNIIPARITGLLLAMANPRRLFISLKVMLKDAPAHRSPNAGWPESAMAANLGLSLAGPRKYGQRMSNDPEMNSTGRRDAHGDDIRDALTMMWRGIGIFAAALLAYGLA